MRSWLLSVRRLIKPGKLVMTNEEMQKLMDFIVRMDRQTTIKLNRLGLRIDSMPAVQSRPEKRWERTEKRIRALLVRAKTTERTIAASRRRSLPLPDTAADKRLKALADLVERQIKKRFKEKP